MVILFCWLWRTCLRHPTSLHFTLTRLECGKNTATRILPTIYHHASSIIIMIWPLMVLFIKPLQRIRSCWDCLQLCASCMLILIDLEHTKRRTIILHDVLHYSFTHCTITTPNILLVFSGCVVNITHGLFEY